MHAARCLHQRLVFAQAARRARQRGRQVDLDQGRRQRLRLQVEHVDAVDAAHAAARAARQLAAPVLQAHEIFLRDTQGHFGGIGAQEHFTVEDGAGRSDHAFRQREAIGKRFQVARGGHHDDVGNAIEDQRDGDFLGDVVDGGKGIARAVAVW